MSLFLSRLRIKQFIQLAILSSLFAAIHPAAADSSLQTAPDGLTAQKIYEMAENRDGKAMGAVRDYLNIKDENGNTALCLAQQNKDRESFKMLLVFGASKDVECYDNTDPICAIIVGEKLKINGAGWLLGAAATAGAVYGAAELLDNKKCPSGYSVQYQSVADCGKTGAEGWIYDWHKKDEDGKKCGRCTPKTYDTGCTTLWQSVNDCGEHPEGWNFESSGYSGDEVCGICTPKQCINRDSTTIRGENIRYTDIKYCPHRNYMRPISQEQKGWSGVHGCFICNYACDEENGFTVENNCELNASGHPAYNCAKDADTQCFYRTTPKACPITDTPQTKGASVAYDTPANCPFRKYMVAESVTPNGWSGEGECFNCNYKCDETYGFATITACKNNDSGGEGYYCQLDPATQCYYRSKTATPDTPTDPEIPCPTVDTPQTKGANVAYDTPANCPFRKYMVAESVTPNGWNGENQCYNCNYKCNEENGFASETTCKTNKAGQEGYICQLDPATQCYYRSQTATPDTPTNPEKPCPSGYDTAYQSVANCVLIGGVEDGWDWEESGWSGELKCGKCKAKACTGAGSTTITDISTCPTIAYKVAVAVQAAGYAGAEACNECIYWCDPEQRAFSSEEACEANASGLKCTEVDGCYVVQDDCPDGYHTWIQNCNNKLHPSGWRLDTSGESNGLKCNKCNPLPCSPSNVTDVSSCGSSGAKGWKLVANGYSGDEICQICQAKECPSNEEKGGCHAGAYEIATATATENYGGNTQCYACDYECYNSYDSKAACQAAASSTQYCKSATNNLTCWYPVEYACPSGYTAGLKKEDCDTYKGGYKDQTIVVPDSENSQGLDSSGNVAYCYKCGFNCTGTHGGEPLVSSKNELGYIYIEIWADPACYLKKLPGSYGQCIDTNGLINSAYPQSYIDSLGCPDIQNAPGTNASNWEKTPKEGFYYGGEQCYICASRPCSDQKVGTDSKCNQIGFTRGDVDGTITTGSDPCFTCKCDEANGYYSSADKVTGCATTVTSLKNYNGKECFYCNKATPAMMTMIRDVVNNQTVVVEHEEGNYAGNITVNAKATVPVTDEETGEVRGGDAVGSITVYNSAANADVAVQNNHFNVYNAEAIGAEEGEAIKAEGTVNLIMKAGAENTTGYGLKTDTDAYNAYAENNASATGLIDITDTEAATNVIYGIQARRNAYNAFANGELARALGSVNIKTKTDLAAYGIHAGKDIYNPNQSVVNVSGTGKGDLYGLYSQAGSVYNSGDVNVHAADGNAYGIYVANGDGQIVDNSGNIIVASDNKTAYGIYVENAGSGMAITNTGAIIATGDDNSRGIKVIQNGGNVRIDNKGRILVNGSLNADGTAIDLGGGTLANRGEVEFIGEQNLDALNGTVAVAEGGSYKAEKLSGTLTIDKSLVKEGFENVYVAENAVNAEDIKGLNITSQSAMFKGSTRQNAENKYDAVATRRDFEEFTPNSSMRDYLEENYRLRRLAEFYNEMKDIETDEELRKQILRKTGADTLINMPQENISALRSASLAIADSVLTPTDEENRIISGADSFINETDGRRGASAYDTNAVTAFMYGDKRLNNRNRLGLGLAYTQMSTSYDNGGDHKENFVNLFIPWLHKISEKLRIASILNIGYGYGDYDRGNGDDADINDFIYGLTNKLVYSINLADIAELEPALVVNAIGYYADDMHDKEMQIKGGNHLSVEAGIGAYLKKELLNAKYGKLTARIGGMYYHELGDPYNKMRAGFKGGVGEFEINDFANIYSRDRAVLSAMLEYEYKRLALYIKYHHLIQRNKAENFDMGIRYNF